MISFKIINIGNGDCLEKVLLTNMTTNIPGREAGWQIAAIRKTSIMTVTEITVHIVMIGTVKTEISVTKAD
jgi:hypothetical protein